MLATLENYILRQPRVPYGLHLALVLVAILVASAPASDQLAEFPEERSMGWVYSRPKASVPEMSWRSLGEARGKIIIPAGMEARLDVAPEACADLTPLARLHGGAIMMINFDRTAVTDSELAPLSALNSLQSLWLGKTRLSDAGLSHLAKLKNLRELNLWGTQITDRGLEKLSELSSLERLSVRYCPITNAGLKSLSSLEKLTILDLEGTRVGPGVVKLLRPMKSLKVLNLGGTNMTSLEIARLGELTSLEQIDLRSLSVDDQALAELSRLPLLRGLDLSLTGLDDRHLHRLEGMHRLESLELAGCKLGSSAQSSLMKLSALRFLNLYDAGVSGHSCKALRDAMPHCQFLW